MTIVAKNSLTLSNINDGTITHYAYAYSSDGTDRFTTTYPNLNLLKGTRTPISWTGNNTVNQTGLIYLFDNGKNVQNQGLSVGDTLTCEFDWVVSNPTSGLFYIQLSGTNWQQLSQDISITRENKSGHSKFSFVVNAGFLSGDAAGIQYRSDYLPTNSVVTVSDLVFAKGSTANPYMGSSSEVTSADWPNYIGQYTDFNTTASTDPAKYTPWTIFKGNDGIAGKDGVGIKTTVITYAISSSGTVTPTAGWNSQVPTLVNGQYLWTKTDWTYTDNSSKTGYSVTYISKDGTNGSNGTGIQTTTITYASSTSGTTAPTSGWTTTVPTVAAGSYLWTKTVWTYTDNTSETGYSVAMMGVKGERGKQIFKSSYESVPHNVGHYWSDLSPAPSIDNPPKIGDTVITPSGNILQIDTVNVGGGGGGGTFGVGDVLGNIKGPSGSNGAPGKVVSDTEPTTRFKGLTWKYSGTADLTASDGTVILSGTEYYWSGTKWTLNEINAHNINGNNLTITDGEFVSTTTNGQVTTSTEIKDNHIAISKTDGTVNTKNDIALDSEQGLAQKFTNIDTGFNRTAGINFQGPFTSDSNGNYAQLTPQGTKLSTDVPWTTLSPTNGFSGGSIQFSVQNGVEFLAIAGLGVPQMNAMQWYQATSLPAGSSAIPSVNRVYAISGNNNAWDLLINPAGGIFIRCQAAVSATSNLVNGGCGFPIG